MNTMSNASLVDPIAIGIYCDVVFGGLDGYIALRSLKEKGGPDAYPAFEWCRPESSIERLVAFARSAEHNGRGCYAIPGVVGTYKRAGKDDVTGFATICVDCDGEEIGESIAYATEAIGPPTLIIRSGGLNAKDELKRHAYWRLSNGYDETDLIAKLRLQLALKIGGDPSFARASQPIRVAGSVYHKGGVRRAVEIEQHAPDRVLSIGEATHLIQRMAPMRGIDEAKVNAEIACQRRRYSMSFDEQLEIPLIRKNGESGITRFDAMTRFIGVWVKAVAEQSVDEDFGIEKCITYARDRIEGSDWTESEVCRQWRAIMDLEMRKKELRRGSR
jgi:putative DNA primase/helicase